MIDYLEQLLDRAPEEEEDAFAWPRIRMRHWKSGVNGEEDDKTSNVETDWAGQQDALVKQAAGQRVEDWQAVLEELTQTVEMEPLLAQMAQRVGGQEQRAERLPADGEAVLTELAEHLDRQERKRGQQAAAEVETVRNADLESRLSELVRAAARGRADHAALWRKQGPANSVVLEGGQTARRRDELRVETRRGLAGVLDAAFERDARRYDGPLGLF